MNKKILLPVLFSLLLVSCDKGPVNNSSLSNSTTNNPTTGWTDEEIAHMEQAIGETLPFSNFSEQRESIGFTDESDGSYVFYMVDYGCGDICESYSTVLENSNYIFVTSDNSNVFEIYLFGKYISDGSTDVACVQFYYYPGDDTYAAAFELYAWTNSESNSNNNPESTLPIMDSWTEDEMTYMSTAIGEVLPLGPFSDSRFSEGYIDELDNSYTFYMYDTECGDACERYGTILLEAGFVSDGIDNSYGYDIYYFCKEIEGSETDLIYIQLGYYPGDDTYAAGFELYAWTYSATSEDSGYTYDVWPEEEINAFCATYNIIIPEFAATGYDLFADEGYLVIWGDTETDIETTYTTACEAAGWIIDGTQYDDYGYIATTSANTSIEMSYYYDANANYFMVYVFAF